MRATERVVFPNKGYPLGCFGVTHVSEDETLVIATEWPRCELSRPIPHAGDDIPMARVRWGRPSRRGSRDCPIHSMYLSRS